MFFGMVFGKIAVYDAFTGLESLCLFEGVSLVGLTGLFLGTWVWDVLKGLSEF